MIFITLNSHFMLFRAMNKRIICEEMPHNRDMKVWRGDEVQEPKKRVKPYFFTLSDTIVLPSLSIPVSSTYSTLSGFFGLDFT